MCFTNFAMGISKIDALVPGGLGSYTLRSAITVNLRFIGFRVSRVLRFLVVCLRDVRKGG